MTTLARRLRLIDYFSLAFGTMIGTGWLVVMDDWLIGSGPAGAILGFLAGGAMLFPIGYVYGKLVMAMPDAGGEVAYTAKVFPRFVSFVTGWIMLLAYFVVCPYEAVAAAKIGGYLFPALNSVAVSGWRQAGLLAASDPKSAGGSPGHSHELPRRSTERHVPDLDHAEHDRSSNSVRVGRIRPRIRRESSTYLSRKCVRVDPTHRSDRPVFHGRVRVGGEIGGGSRSWICRTPLFPRHRDGHCGSDPVLRDDHRGGRVFCASPKFPQ